MTDLQPALLFLFLTYAFLDVNSSPVKNRIVFVLSSILFVSRKRFFNDSKFLLLNDVAVIGEDQFYASNFLYFENWYLSILEHNFPLALGGLIYLDAKGADEKLKGLNSPNGLAVSKDKK